MLCFGATTPSLHGKGQRIFGVSQLFLFSFRSFFFFGFSLLGSFFVPRPVFSVKAIIRQIWCRHVFIDFPSFPFPWASCMQQGGNFDTDRAH